jgi:hypothetical protein
VLCAGGDRFDESVSGASFEFRVSGSELGQGTQTTPLGAECL